MGSLGWSGFRGKSALWVSTGFWREYHAAQAVKLAIVDAAFAAGSMQCAGGFNAAVSA
jgi:anti-sigma-K factor RskA